jgi:hypothetical protein
MSNTRTIIVLIVLFIAGGLHALIGFLSPTLYASLNAILLGIETLLQINTSVQNAMLKKDMLKDISS